MILTGGGSENDRLYAIQHYFLRLARTKEGSAAEANTLRVVARALGLVTQDVRDWYSGQTTNTDGLGQHAHMLTCAKEDIEYGRHSRQAQAQKRLHQARAKIKRMEAEHAHALSARSAALKSTTDTLARKTEAHAKLSAQNAKLSAANKALQQARKRGIARGKAKKAAKKRKKTGCPACNGQKRAHTCGKQRTARQFHHLNCHEGCAAWGNAHRAHTCDK